PDEAAVENQAPFPDLEEIQGTSPKIRFFHDQINKTGDHEGGLDDVKAQGGELFRGPPHSLRLPAHPGDAGQKGDGDHETVGVKLEPAEKGNRKENRMH